MNPTLATLTGLAVGDALGVQFETAPFDDPRLLRWDGKMGPSEYHQLRAGQWSDDTMMAKLLSESLLYSGTYCPGDAAKRYAAWLESGDKRGMGKATERALSRLRSGLSWTQSGIIDAEGNGSAMRAAPIGVFYHHNVEAASHMAVVDASITHGSKEAQCGSVAVAVATAVLTMGGDRHSFAYKVLDWLPEGSRVRLGIESVVRLCEDVFWKSDMGPTTVRAASMALAAIGTKSHVVQTVPAAFLAFMATESYKDAVEAAIRAGGDTDTTAAITGALAGTFYGIDQVRPYLASVEKCDLLRNLEERLFSSARPVYHPA